MAESNLIERHGFLHPNKFQEKEKNQPDMTGKVLIQGVEYRLAGWWKEGRNTGEKYLSIAVNDNCVIIDNPKQQDKKEDDIPF